MNGYLAQIASRLTPLAASATPVVQPPAPNPQAEYLPARPVVSDASGAGQDDVPTAAPPASTYLSRHVRRAAQPNAPNARPNVPAPTPKARSGATNPPVDASGPIAEAFPQPVQAGPSEPSKPNRTSMTGGVEKLAEASFPKSAKEPKPDRQTSLSPNVEVAQQVRSDQKTADSQLITHRSVSDESFGQEKIKTASGAEGGQLKAQPPPEPLLPVRRPSAVSDADIRPTTQPSEGMGRQPPVAEHTRQPPQSLLPSAPPMVAPAPAPAPTITIGKISVEVVHPAAPPPRASRPAPSRPQPPPLSRDPFTLRFGFGQL